MTKYRKKKEQSKKNKPYIDSYIMIDTQINFVPFFKIVKFPKAMLKYLNLISSLSDCNPKIISFIFSIENSFGVTLSFELDDLRFILYS